MKFKVEMTQFRRAQAYFALIESQPLENIIWVENDKPIPVTDKQIADCRLEMDGDG